MSLFNCAHPSVWTFLDRLRKDLTIYKLNIVAANVEQNGSQYTKYVKLAEHFAIKVANYNYEADKLKYLHAVVKISFP